MARDSTTRQEQSPVAGIGRREFAAGLTALREKAGLSIRDLARQVGSPSATVGGYLSGRHLPPISQLDLLGKILRACGVTDEAEIQRWIDDLAAIRQTPGPRAGNTPTPYRGLRSFQPEDAGSFYGRESLTSTLLDRLDASDGIVVVVGPSGSGKSSVLRAGLVPAIRAGALQLPGRSARREIIMVPGAAPMAALQVAMDAPPADGHEPADGSLLLVDQFEELFTSCPDRAEQQTFLAELRRLAKAGPDGSHRVLVVLGLRADFYPVAAREPELIPILQDAQVIVGPMTESELREAIEQPANRLGIVVEEDLVRLLLVELAPRTGGPDAHDAGALPLLSHALLTTWQRSKRGRMTVTDYRASGGIESAVQQTAEDLYNDLDGGVEEGPERQQARRIFLRMVNVDDDAVITRRRVTRAELDESAGPILARFIQERLLTAKQDTVEISHEALLLAWPRLREWVDADKAGLRTRRNITYSAQVWQDSGRDPLTLLRGSSLEAARELLPGADSDRSGLQNPLTLNVLEREFVQAGLDQEEQEREMEAQQQQAARRRTRQLRRLLAVLAVLVLLASGFAIFGFQSRSEAQNQTQIAAEARDRALSRQVAGTAETLRQNDPSLAAQLALAAYRISPTVDARSALLDSVASPLPIRLLGPVGPTTNTINPAGTVVAVSNAMDGSIALRAASGRPETPPVLATLTSADITAQQYAMAFSPDGRLLAAGNSVGTVQLWEVGDPGATVDVAVLAEALPSGVQALGFSPDGRTLAAAGAGGQIVRWDLTDPTAPKALPPVAASDLMQAVAYSPDSELLVAGGIGEGAADLRFWRNGADPELITQLNLGETTVTTTVFSPDGNTLAVGVKAKRVHFYDVTDPAEPVEITTGIVDFASWVNTIDYSPDGSRVAVSSSDNSVRVINTADWSTVETFRHNAPVTGTSFTADGSVLFTSSSDGQTRVWQVPGPVISGFKDTVFFTAFGPDPDLLFIGSGQAQNTIKVLDIVDRQRPDLISELSADADDGSLNGGVITSPDGAIAAVSTRAGRVQFFDISDPARPTKIGAALTGPTATIQSMHFTPDGTVFAVGSDDSSVWLWDVSDIAAPVQLSTISDIGGLVFFIDLSRDGRYLAATGDGVVRIWDIIDPAAPKMVHTLTFDGYAYTLAYSPTADLLAATGADSLIRLYDVTDPAAPVLVGQPLSGPTGEVYWLTFSPDGATLAGGSTDGGVWLWDMADPAAPAPVATLKAAEGSVFSVTFSPDGSVLAGGGGDLKVRTWLTDPAAVSDIICSQQGDGITEDEWNLYIPEQEFRPPCTQ